MIKKILIIILLIIISVGGYYIYQYLTNKHQIAAKNTFYPQNLKISIQKPATLKSNLMFFGDVFWGRFMDVAAQKSPLGEEFPFSKLDTLQRQDYDAWIGSLNCPVTDAQIPAQKQEDTLMFNCTPNYLENARKWFNVFSLANSHTSNQNGLVGFEKTRNYLDEYDFQYFGHYDKNFTDEICEIVLIGANGYTDKNMLDSDKHQYPISDFWMPIAMCGYHNTFTLATDEQLDEIAKYAKYLPTLVYAIQGGEYNTVADDMQRKYFRAMIDRGADAIIGKGAHVVQDTEAYKGKPIIYSMGNFVYDQQWMADVMHGIGVEVRYDFDYDENMQKLQNIAHSCKIFKDDCLEKIISLGIKKPTYEVRFDIVATDNSGLTARKAGENLQKAMMQRTGWEQTKSGIKY